MRQGPREITEVALLEKQRNDAVLVAFLNQGVIQFTLDPHGFYGMRREDECKPTTSGKGGSDFVLPLLRAANVVRAEPYWYPIGNQKISELAG